VLPPIKSGVRMAILNLTAFKETSTPNLISRWRVRYQAAQKFIFRIASRLLCCCWGPALSISTRAEFSGR
jgi:hypothetical protein